MSEHIRTINGPHQGQPVVSHGAPIEEAEAVMLMVHGRGATAESILALADELDQPGFAYMAPQAADNEWYPNSLLALLDSNEPYLSSAITLLESVLMQLVGAGIENEKIMLLGFSQGACLVLEFASRFAQRYGGVVGLSGATIGPDGTIHDYGGSLEGTPVFLGCSDTDPHIPRASVEESAHLLEELGGNVTMRIYPNMGHTLNRDELDTVRKMMQVVLDTA